MADYELGISEFQNDKHSCLKCGAVSAVRGNCGANGSRIKNLCKLAIIVAEASSSILREMDLVSG